MGLPGVGVRKKRIRINVSHLVDFISADNMGGGCQFCLHTATTTDFFEILRNLSTTRESIRGAIPGLRHDYAMPCYSEFLSHRILKDPMAREYLR